MNNAIQFDTRDMGAIFVEYLGYAIGLLHRGETTAALFYFRRAQAFLVDG